MKKIFRRIPLPIFSGPNLGHWWSIATGVRYFRGKFVPGKGAALPLLINGGEVVWDIGSHRGYTVILEARCVGAEGRVFAFEPNPDSRDFIELHLRWNRARNTTLFPWAIGRAEGEQRFGWNSNEGQSTLACHLGGEGHVVRVKGIDQLIAAGIAPSPTFIKMDIEGAELDALHGAAELLQRERGLALALATHSAALHDECCELLVKAGFTVIEADNVAIARSEGWPSIGDADVLAFAHGRVVSPAAREAFARIGRHG